MKKLSGLDASFLYLETENAPMHIGGVLVLDRGTGEDRLTFEGLKEFIASRVHLVPAFRERLVEDPFKLTGPQWIRCGSFDLDRHVERTTLPEPGGWKELHALMAWELSRPMDRRYPLWGMLWVDGLNVEGLPEGAVALVTKMHHAAIDGMSGAEILGALFDLTPEPREVPEPEPWEPEEVPPRTRFLKQAGKTAAGLPRHLVGTIGQTVKGIAGYGAAWGLKRIPRPPGLFSAPRTRLNVPISKDKVWTGVRFDLGRIKAVKKSVEGGTVNDVVLAVCAGALRRYLEEKEDLPEEPLIAMAPISIRAEEEREDLGNRVSAMLISLATDVEDPAERFQAIHKSARSSKIYHQAVGAETLTDYTSYVSFSVASLALRLYTGAGASKLHKPLFNVVITNVPGPQVPLYLGGAKLLAHMGAAPIFDGIGLTLVVFSYAGTLSIGATSCRRMMPDADRFGGMLEEALVELEGAVGG